MKPQAFEGEELDNNDPDSFYYIYMATKQEDMVIKRQIKIKKVVNQHLDPTKRHKAARI